MQTNKKQLARRRNLRQVLPLACAGLAGLALPVLAQNASEYESIEPSGETGPSGQLRMGVGLGYRMESDVDGGGKSDEMAVRTTLAGNYALTEKMKLGLAASYQFSHYGFSETDLDDLDVHLLRVTPLLQYAIDDKWLVYGGPSVAFAGESGADFGDSVTGGGLVGLNYRFSETLSMGAGFGIFSKIEDDPSMLPFVTVNWQIDDKWYMKVGFTEVAANGGLGAEISYEMNDSWKVGGGIAFLQKRFRLENGGVVQDKSIPIYGKVTWQASAKTSLELLAGVATGGEYRVEDSNGDKIGDTDYDPSALIGVRVLFQF